MNIKDFHNKNAKGYILFATITLLFVGTTTILSFYTTKLLTSGGHGGAVFSKNKTLIKKIKDYLEFDQRKDSNFRFNFKLSEINAAIGRMQLKKLNFFLQRRENIFKEYNV